MCGMAVELYPGPLEAVDPNNGNALVLVSTRAALVAVLGVQMLLVLRLPEEIYDLPLFPGDFLLDQKVVLWRDPGSGGT